MGKKNRKKARAGGKKTAGGKARAGGGLVGAIAQAGVGALGGGVGRARGGGGSRRRKGPTYWANKVLVEKLKKKYNRIKYGGMR